MNVQSSAGSAYLKGVGELHVSGGSALLGQLVLDGTVAGLRLSGDLAAGQGITLSAGNQSLSMDATTRLQNGTGQMLLRGSSISMADGARIDGGTGTMVLTAVNDIEVTGITSANATRGAIIVSSSRGRVLDAGDLNPYDLRVTDLSGGIQVTAYGDMGNGTLATSDARYALDLDGASLQLTSRTGAVLVALGDQNVSDMQATARTDFHLTSAIGNVTASRVVASRGSLSMRSNGHLALSSVSSLGDMYLQGGSVQANTVSSRTGEVDIRSVAELSPLLPPAGLQIGTATAYGKLSLTSNTGILANTLSAKRGGITVAAGSSMQATTLNAYGALSVSAVGGMQLTSGRSTTAGIELSSAAAGVLANTLTAATGMKVTASTTAQLGSFRAGAGGADFAAATLSLTSGRSAGSILIRAAGVAQLGALQTTAGQIAAQTLGLGSGFQFSTLRAPGGIQLQANDQTLSHATVAVGPGWVLE